MLTIYGLNDTEGLPQNIYVWEVASYGCGHVQYSILRSNTWLLEHRWQSGQDA